MSTKDPAEFFDEQQAEQYDQRFIKLAPLREALDLLVKAVLSDLPTEARVLSVGAGTGAEVLTLAARFPGWRFVAVDPSAAMLDVARRKAEAAGIAGRCEFHVGRLETLPPAAPFDAATSFFVSRFLLDYRERVAFFREIASRLDSRGRLVTADLVADLSTRQGQWQLDNWLRLMREEGGIPAEHAEKMREAYARDVAVRSAAEVTAMIVEGGFAEANVFHQAGLMHAWHAQRAAWPQDS